MAKWVDMVEDGAVIYSAILFGVFNLRIHHYRSQNLWYLSCDGLFDNVPLKYEKLSVAKCQAMKKLQTVLQEALDEILKDYK